MYNGDGNRVIAVENGVTTVYIGNYFEAELGTGTTYPVFVPDVVQDELPNKLYLPVLMNGQGTGNGAPQVGPGFYLTHPIIDVMNSTNSDYAKTLRVFLQRQLIFQGVNDVARSSGITVLSDLIQNKVIPE